MCYSLALDALFPAGVDESRLFLVAAAAVTFFRSGDVSTSVSTWSPPFFLRPPPLPEEVMSAVTWVQCDCVHSLNFG